ncbi:MAG: cytochrome c biogenesis protein CcdA [Actinomycetota bacterium]|nr:cytochrome c biogenesis protein CcdA [Actinomycetota bacterium]
MGLLADVASNVGAWWAPFLALAAGLVSFVSPCVLPLVPGYLAFVTGGDQPAADTKTRILPILLFILGFSIVFTVVAGFTASAISGWLRSEGVQRVAGVVVLGFGAFLLLYAFRLGVPGLYRESHPFLAKVKPGAAAALPLGMAFAVGWTPCIGPVLGAILTLAASQGSTGRAVLLLAFYSVGLGLPFLLIGIGVRRVMGAFRFLTRNYHWIAGASGVALSVIGVLLLTGVWTELLNPLLRLVNRFTPAI